MDEQVPGDSAKSGEFRDEKGRFTPGNPGKPKGVKNRFTRIKEHILDAYDHQRGDEKLKEADFKYLMALVMGCMPKDDGGDSESNPDTLPFRVEAEPDADQEKPV